MFVNGNLFNITSSRKLKFVTVEKIPSQTSEQISKRLYKVVKLYGYIVLIIYLIPMDIEF